HGASRRLARALAVAASTVSMVVPMRPRRAIRSTQRTKVRITTANTSTVTAKRANRLAGPKYWVFTDVSGTMLKIKAPIKVDRAFCETSSAIISLKDLGVAVVLAEA